MGLAAPQIGVGLRVVIFGVKSNPRYPQAEEVPDTVLVNPVLTPLASGVPVVLPQSLVGPQILRALTDGEATVIVAVPPGTSGT